MALYKSCIIIIIIISALDPNSTGDTVSFVDVVSHAEGREIKMHVLLNSVLIFVLCSVYLVIRYVLTAK